MGGFGEMFLKKTPNDQSIHIVGDMFQCAVKGNGANCLKVVRKRFSYIGLKTCLNLLT